MATTNKPQKWYDADDPGGPAISEDQMPFLTSIIEAANKQDRTPKEVFDEVAGPMNSNKAARFHYKLKLLEENPDLPVGVRPLKAIPLEKTAVGERYYMTPEEAREHSGFAGSLRPKDLAKLGEDVSNWRPGYVPIRKKSTTPVGRFKRGIIPGAAKVHYGTTKLLPTIPYIYTKEDKAKNLESIRELYKMTEPKGFAGTMGEMVGESPGYLAGVIAVKALAPVLGLTGMKAAWTLASEVGVGAAALGALEGMAKGKDTAEVLKGAGGRGLTEATFMVGSAFLLKYGAKGLVPVAKKVGSKYGAEHPATKLLDFVTKGWQPKAASRVGQEATDVRGLNIEAATKEFEDAYNLTAQKIIVPDAEDIVWRTQLGKIYKGITAKSTTEEFGKAIGELDNLKKTFGKEGRKIKVKEAGGKTIDDVAQRVEGLFDATRKPWQMTAREFNKKFVWHHTSRLIAKIVQSKGMTKGTFGTTGRRGTYKPGDVTVFVHRRNLGTHSEKAGTLYPNWKRRLKPEGLHIIDRAAKSKEGPHKRFVREALMRGDDVPANVRADYKEMISKMVEDKQIKAPKEVTPTQAGEQLVGAAARKKAAMEAAEEVTEEVTEEVVQLDLPLNVDDTPKTNESNFGRGMFNALKELFTNPENAAAKAAKQASFIFEQAQTFVRRSGLGRQMDKLQEAIEAAERSARRVTESIEVEMALLRKKADVPNPLFQKEGEGIAKTITAKESVSYILQIMYKKLDDSQWKIIKKSLDDGTFDPAQLNALLDSVIFDDDALKAAVKIKGWQDWLGARAENMLNSYMVKHRNINWVDPKWDTLKEVMAAAGLKINPKTAGRRPFIQRQDFGFPMTLKKELLIKGSETRKEFIDMLLRKGVIKKKIGEEAAARELAEDYVDAVLLGDGLADLRGITKKPGAMPPASLQFERQGYLADKEFAKFIERDPDVFVSRYFRSATKYLEMQKELGLIGDIGLPEQLVTALYRMVDGTRGAPRIANAEQVEGVLRVIIQNPQRSPLAEKIMQVTAAKSLVLSWIENTSGLINNWMLTDGAVAKLAFRQMRTAEGKAYARLAGAPATVEEGLKEVAADSSNKLFWMPWLRLFKIQEGIMRSHAALSGRIWALKMGKRLLRDNNDRLAVTELGKLKLNARKFVDSGFRFTDDELVIAGQEMIERTQFRALPMYKPAWASPRGEDMWKDLGPLLWQFRTWLYGQGRLYGRESGVSTLFGAAPTTPGRAARAAGMQLTVALPAGYIYLLKRKLWLYRGDFEGVHQDYVEPMRRYFIEGDHRPEVLDRVKEIAYESFDRVSSSGIFTGSTKRYPKPGGPLALGSIVPAASLVTRPIEEAIIRPLTGKKFRYARAAGEILGPVGGVAGLARPALGAAAIAGGRLLASGRRERARLGQAENVTDGIFLFLATSPEEQLNYLLSEDVSPLLLHRILKAGTGSLRSVNRVIAKDRELRGAKGYAGSVQDFVPALDKMLGKMNVKELETLGAKVREGEREELTGKVKSIFTEEASDEALSQQAKGVK